MTYFSKHTISKQDVSSILRALVLTAFDRNARFANDIEEVFPKGVVGNLETIVDEWLKTPLNQYRKTSALNNLSLMEQLYDEPEEESPFWLKDKPFRKAGATVVDLMMDKEYDRDSKINMLVLTFDGNCKGLRNAFPDWKETKLPLLEALFRISAKSRI